LVRTGFGVGVGVGGGEASLLEAIELGEAAGDLVGDLTLVAEQGIEESGARNRVGTGFDDLTEPIAFFRLGDGLLMTGKEIGVAGEDAG